MKALKFALFLILFSTFCYSQEPNDCVNAITICGNGTFTSDATGYGSIQEVAGCSGSEHNSIWLKINIVNGGTLGFNLIPTNTGISVDYDFWVYGANKPCTNLGSPIRCCTTNPALANLTSNVTGMIGTTVTTTSGPGANGNGFVRWLTVSPGEFYYIAIDRPEGDGGFQLQWTGTAMNNGGAFPTSPTANSLGEVRSCSNTPNVGIFDFNGLKSQINSDIINNTISFYLTESNALDGVAALPLIYGNTSNPQTIYAKVKNNVSGCFTITSFQLKVFEVPNATISTSTSAICNNQNGIVIINGTPNAIIEYNINSGATQTAILDNLGVFQISTPLTITSIFTVTKVKIVDTANVTLCTQNLNNFVTVTVTPDNTVTAASSFPSICVQTVMPTITHTTSGATGIGTATGLPLGVTATWASNTITITGTPTGLGIFNYVIPLTGGCGSVNATGTITVVSENTVSAPSSTPSTCINTMMSTVTHATTGATGIGTATGLPTGVFAVWSANTITISGTPTVSGIFNYTLPLTGGCGLVAATGTITVTLDNTVSVASASPIICVNSLLPSISHTTTGATGIGTAINLPLGVSAVWSANTITISGTPTNSGIFNYLIPLTGGCGGSATGIITITPENTVTAGTLSPSICVQTVLPIITHTTTGATGIGTATGLPLGVSAVWSVDTITITGTPSASGIFNYAIPLTGGCGSVNATGTITVVSENTVSAHSSTPSTCINTMMSTVTHTTTGATGIGTATGLPTGVFAVWSANTITISGTPTVSGIFNYTLPLTGGCGLVAATGTITVTLDNTVSVASASPIICVNSLLPSISHTTTGATGIGTAINLPLGVSAVWSANTITISGTPTNSGIFNYLIPLTGGCGGSATGIITITPENTVTAGTLSPSICVQTVLPTITHTTTGATGIGTATGLPLGVSAVWSVDTITITGTPSASGIFNYAIPLTGGCGSVNATGTITVKPNNTVSAPSSTPSTCINTMMSTVTHTTTGATGIGTATGLPTGVFAVWSANTITISGTPMVSGIFNYTIPLTGGCELVHATGTITVIPNKTVTAASASPILCVNTVLPTITHATTGVTGIGTAIGLPIGVTAIWSANTISISGTPTSTGIYNYTIPLIGTCGVINATGTINVRSLPTNVTIAGTTTTCAGFPVNLTLTGTPGTQITWSGLPSTIQINSSGSNVITVSPSVTTNYELLSADLNGCGVSIIGQMATVNVSSTPQFVSQISDFEVCNGGLLNISSQLSSTVSGTTFNWSATTNNVQLITMNGDQNNINQIATLINNSQNGTISLVVTPRIGNCSGTSQQVNITINAIPIITAVTSNTTVICNNAIVAITANSNLSSTKYNWQINTATGVQIAGGVTSGTSVTSLLSLQLILTNPLTAGTISFDFTPVNGICTGATITNAVTFTVNPLPGTPQLIDFSVNEICSGESANLSISSLPNIGGTTLVWTVVEFQNVSGFANGSALAPYTINDVLTNNSDVQGFVKYRVISQLGNCTGGPSEFIVWVNPLPKPAMNDGFVCIDQSSGVTYQGYVLEAGIYNPNLSYKWYKWNETTATFDFLTTTTGPNYGVTQPGVFQVEVTNMQTNCSQSDLATVVPVYPASGINTVITDAFSENATITVSLNTPGTGNLLYSLDGGAWQTSNVFSGVHGGTHEIKIMDTEGCTNLTKEILVIDYPRFFTPNGDGINDFWYIDGGNQLAATISIYDRFGKLLSQFPAGSNNQGWDGTYLGYLLPSTDYWFTINYTENNQKKIFRAHFALKR
jgi:gliding motility-associated-like protein